jgi:hypothetical protein
MVIIKTIATNIGEDIVVVVCVWGGRNPYTLLKIMSFAGKWMEL